MKLEVLSEYDSIVVKFNGITHLRVKRSKLIGYQSWKMGDNEYHIEITLVGGTIHTEYNDIEKWSTILKGLDEHF